VLRNRQQKHTAKPLVFVVHLKFQATIAIAADNDEKRAPHQSVSGSFNLH